MKNQIQNDIAVEVLSSVSTAARLGTGRVHVGQKLGRVVALTKSSKVFAVGASRRAAKAASRFSGAGLERSVLCQRSARPRHFAFAGSSGIISLQALLLSSPVSIRAVCKPPNALPPNHSLNRTHCGMRLKALHFILGF